jgi:nucleoside-diphosphate-sugar epimerase
MPSAFVLGSGGQIGRAASAALRDHGWEVCAATSKDLDREDTAALAAATRGSDLLVDVIPYTAAHARQLLTLDVGAIVAISSAAVYGLLGSDLPVPIGEDHPRVEPSGRDYATNKVAMEDVLLGQDAIPASVLRPCAIHGPGSRAPREWYFEKRRLDGRTRAPVAFGGRSVFHTTAAVNLAELVVRAAGAHGAFNAGDPDPPSVADIARLIGIEPVPVEGEPPGSSTPWSVEHAFVVDMAKAERVLGYAPVTTYEQALPATLAWLREADPATDFPGLAAYPEDLFDYAAEDRLL